MRIVSGKFKGKRIVAPRNLPVRPTTDMAKEALFNILNNQYYFDQISVLDLFSGIGSICLEFSSRGTASIMAVDNHPGCARFLEQTSDELAAGIEVIKSDVFKYLERTQATFDVIFADPPYEIPEDQFIKIIDLVFERKLLADEGTLIIEHGKKTDLSNQLRFIHSRKYGGNVFSFFQ